MRFFLSTLTSKSVLVNLEVWMNYINLQKQSSRSKYSNTTTAGFKCVGKLGGGGEGGPTSFMPFKWISLLCSLSSKERISGIIVKKQKGQCFQLFSMPIFSLHHNTGTLWAKRGKRGILLEAREEGRRKNKALVTSPLLWLFRSPTPTNIDWRQWCQKDQWKHDPLLENCHLSGYQKRRQQHKP